MLNIVYIAFTPISLLLGFMIIYLPIYTLGYLVFRNTSFDVGKYRKKFIKYRRKLLKIILSILLFIELFHIVIILLNQFIVFSSYVNIGVSIIITIPVIWLSFFFTLIVFYYIEGRLKG